jgi:hypothetical protein
MLKPKSFRGVVVMVFGFVRINFSHERDGKRRLVHIYIYIEREREREREKD